MIQAFQVCHGNVIRYCVCRALQLDPQVLPLVLVPLSNFTLHFYQTLPLVEPCVQCSSFAFCATVLSNFCQRCSFVLSHFVHYCFAWQTCSKESLEGLAEDGGTQWLHYSSGDKAQRQGNENLFTLHRLYFSSYFTTTSQVSLLELGGAGHFDSEMLTFN